MPDPTYPALVQYVVLPTQGLRAHTNDSSPGVRRYLSELAAYTQGERLASTMADHLEYPRALAAPGARVSAAASVSAMAFTSAAASAALGLRVVDSIHDDGAKLIEIDPEHLPALRALQPGLRFVPIAFYKPALAPRLAPHVEVRARPHAARAATATTLKVVSKTDGTPIDGATVIAFTDFAARTGVQGVTNKKGEVRLAVSGRTPLDRLYVYPVNGYWSALRKKFTPLAGATIPLIPLALDYTDGVRFFYGSAADNSGAGVTVGVVDTGIATNHPDLTVQGGVNTVVGEDQTAFGDNGHGHGTHVAGIIAARGQPPKGIRGLAPGVTLRSYRVFARGAETASNYSIAKAIDRALTDGCDLINLSLGGGEPDDVLRAAVEDARTQGALVIVAAGNDDHGPVNFPASDAMAIAVSAMGRKGTYPNDATEAGEAAKPYGKDRKNFIAAFSNIGLDVDLTAPGVGILSCFPGGYAALSGTSMACPAVTGMAAQRLAAEAHILSMPRDGARSEAMARLILGAAQSLGFGPQYEGRGMIR